MKKQKKKVIKIYARISKDDKELILDWDESPQKLAERWHTTRNCIYSSITHHHPTYEKIVITE